MQVFMTLEDIDQLLPKLKQYGVKEFKHKDLHVVFHVEQPQIQEKVQSVVEEKINESDLPVDLRAESINQYDSILNWSASPPQDDKSDEMMPMTGEERLPIP